MSLSVYLAGPYNARENIKAIRTILRDHGITDTSRWVDSHLEEGDHVPFKQREHEAREDLIDVYRADAFVLLNHLGNSTTGGMHLETGYAIAARKPICLVGTPTNVFHYLDTITVVPDIPALLRVLKRIEERLR